MTNPTAPASAPDEAPVEVPVFRYEKRYFEDSQGRRIEFRQLLPGSADPGPEHFHEFLGTFRITLVVAGAPNNVPVNFNIPGVSSVMEAFEVFDALAEKAAKQAEEDLKARLTRIALEQGGKAGMAAGLVGQDGKPLVQLQR